MTAQPFEDIAQYGGVNAHILILPSSSGLSFIAPGNKVDPNDPLILAARDATNSRGLATVIADLSKTEIHPEKMAKLYMDFIRNFRAVIDGYRENNPNAPQNFELIGHSVGAIAALEALNAFPHYPISRLTLIDPAPMSSRLMQGIHCPVDIIVSRTDPYEKIGRTAYAEIAKTSPQARLHVIETSTDPLLGHMFRGNEAEIAQIIRSTQIAPAPAPHPAP